MEIKPLNREKQKHLYLQIAKQIQKKIETFELKEGDLIPSERELAETYKVSRITTKNAIEYLQEKGLVYREVGRGTFVAKPKMQKIFAFKGFSEFIRSTGRIPGSEIIEQNLLEADESIADELQIAIGDSYISIERIRTADKEPVALQKSYIPSHICPDLENKDITTRSLYSIFKEEYGIFPAWAEAEVRACLADEKEAQMLKIEKGNALLVVNALTLTEKFEVIEKVTTKYIGNYRDIYIGRQRIE